MSKGSARTLKYWLDKGYSEKDANIMRLSRIPGMFEYFNIFKGKSVEESEKLSKLFWESKSVTIKNMIKKYGEEEGTKRFNEYRNRQAYTNTLNYFIENYGEEEGKLKYFNANKNRAITIKNMIKKYGEEEGTKRFTEYRKKQAYVGTSLDYFVEKYGKVDGEIKYRRINFLKSHTFESYLERYDNDYDVALKKYSEYCGNRLSNTKTTSAISIEMFNEIKDVLLLHGYEKIYYHLYTTEFGLQINHNYYMVDFYLGETKKCIEFYGDYWHCNPTIYKETDIIKFPNNIFKFAKDVWLRDENRITVLKTDNRITDIMIVWQNDYVTNKQQVIDRCVYFLCN